MSNTHVNINHPDKHQYEDYYPKLVHQLESDLRYMTQKYDRACDDLRSLYERIDEGKEVYFIKPNGELMYVKEDKERA